MITSSGGIHAQKLFFSIKKKSLHEDIKIHAANNNYLSRRKVYFHDSFTKIPNFKSKKFIKTLKKIIKKKNIDILIPGSDEEAIKLCESKNKFTTFISCPNKKNLEFIKNKYNVLLKLKKKKFISTYFEKISYQNILKKKVNSLKFKDDDFVLKPIFSRGGRDVLTIKRLQTKDILSFNKGRELQVKKSFFYKNKNKFLSKFKNKFPIIIMERLFGPNLDIDILAWKGKLIKYVIRQRIGFQAEKGSIILTKNHKIEKIIKNVVKLFNLTGIYDCDFMFNKKKQPSLLELNPRISGSLYASIFSGANLIEDLILLKKNQIEKINNFNIKNKKKVFSKNLNK